MRQTPQMPAAAPAAAGKQPTRREFLRGAARGLLAGALVAGVGGLVARRGDACARYTACAACPALAGCRLPRGVAARGAGGTAGTR